MAQPWGKEAMPRWPEPLWVWGTKACDRIRVLTLVLFLEKVNALGCKFLGPHKLSDGIQHSSIS